MAHVVCSLPWPPSANHAWRPTRDGGKILTDGYKSFIKAVGDCVLVQRIPRYWTCDKLVIAVGCRPPNARSFDIDNRIKTLLDAMQRAGVIEDDKHVDTLIVRRASSDPPHGSVIVRVEEVSHLPPSFEAMFTDWFCTDPPAATRRTQCPRCDECTSGAGHAGACQVPPRARGAYAAADHV